MYFSNTHTHPILRNLTLLNKSIELVYNSLKRQVYFTYAVRMYIRYIGMNTCLDVWSRNAMTCKIFRTSLVENRFNNGCFQI